MRGIYRHWPPLLQRRHRSRPTALALPPELSLVGRMPHFDSGDWLNLGDSFGNLGEAVDGEKGTVSFWAKFHTDVGGVQTLYQAGPSGHVIINHTAADKWRIVLETAADTTILQMDSANAYNVASGLHHVFATWDLEAEEAYIYINGADETTFLVSPINTVPGIDYTGDATSDVGFGATETGSTPIGACIGNFWFSFTEFFDPTVPGVLELFRSVGGNPTDLSSVGSPTVYFDNPVATWHQNRGSGSDFTVTGALTECAGFESTVGQPTMRRWGGVPGMMLTGRRAW